MAAGYEEHMSRVEERRARLGETLQALFPEPLSLTLEIGCGHGHWLVGYGEANPEKQCLGVDIIGDRLDRAERKRDRAGLNNIQFARAEAYELLQLLPARVQLEEIFVLFPDPWPKKRHWKNRLFSQRFLSVLASRCQQSTQLHFRTDHEGYFEWATEVIDSQKVWKGNEVESLPFELETVFQQRASGFQTMSLVKER